MGKPIWLCWGEPVHSHDDAGLLLPGCKASDCCDSVNKLGHSDASARAHTLGMSCYGQAGVMACSALVFCYYHYSTALREGWQYGHAQLHVQPCGTPNQTPLRTPPHHCTPTCGHANHTCPTLADSQSASYKRPPPCQNYRLATA